ncbi:HNH endonuclease [Rhodococcus sp. JT-3]|uniref:HNH endonuclease n=1 Tax=Rhodococcus sp. JT-3 TaxID=1973213 RepID=UPI001302EF6F|nr:HNH endonuclease [Rhodococcus sp. JT-3]
MIELRKGPTPSWLQENQVAQTKRYKLAPVDKKPSPWREKEIVLALKEESFKKCIYCEGIIDDVSYSAVEHIKPKHVFEDLVLDWNNLGLVCQRCNTNKGVYWTDDKDLQLLNPYQDSLAEHIAFRGPLTVAYLHSSRANNTVKKLKLHLREDLLLSRMRRIQELHVRLQLWHDEINMEKKEIFADDVRDAISVDCEFSGVLRAYAAESGFPAE